MDEWNGEWVGGPTRKREQSEGDQRDGPRGEVSPTSRANTIKGQDPIGTTRQRDESIGVVLPQDPSADIESESMSIFPPREPQFKNEDEDRGLEQRPSGNTNHPFPNLRHRQRR